MADAVPLFKTALGLSSETIGLASYRLVFTLHHECVVRGLFVESGVKPLGVVELDPAF